MSVDDRKIAYSRPQPTAMVADIFLPAAMDLDADDHLWVPQAEGVWFRPLVLSVSQGYYVNLLRVRKSGMLSRHRHSGPVHAFPLRGRWHYLEHDWVAVPGSYAFEPPGETHTLVVPDDVEDMITLFHVTGGYVYVDPYGVAEGYEDVFTKIDAVKRHHQSVGLTPDVLEGLIK